MQRLVLLRPTRPAAQAIGYGCALSDDPENIFSETENNRNLTCQSNLAYRSVGNFGSRPWHRPVKLRRERVFRKGFFVNQGSATGQLSEMPVMRACKCRTRPFTVACSFKRAGC